jgi:hypothetical protein
MTTREAQKFVSTKIAQLQREGMSRRQSVRVAFEEARNRGFRVPPAPGGDRAERRP